MIIDIWTEKGNDSLKYQRVDGQVELIGFKFDNYPKLVYT